MRVAYFGIRKKYTHPNIKQPLWLANIGMTEKRSRLGMMGMMLSMSKQVSLPKISSILQKMKIGPESDLPPFCTKAFNYNIFFPGRESPVFSHFYEMTWKDFNWLHVPFCSRLPRVWKWNMPLEFMVCLVVRYDFHLKISLQYVQSCGERGWEFVNCNLFFAIVLVWTSVVCFVRSLMYSLWSPYHHQLVLLVDIQGSTCISQN